MEIKESSLNCMKFYFFKMKLEINRETGAFNGKNTETKYSFSNNLKKKEKKQRKKKY